MKRDLRGGQPAMAGGASVNGRPATMADRPPSAPPSVLSPPGAWRTVRVPPDAAAVVLLLILIGVAGSNVLAGGTLLALDTATQYYPWSAFLGESLRAWRVPGWNPHTFSGAPFAADPLSGWTYLPAMLAFGALPLVPAIDAYVLLHLLLAGLGTYALARALGMSASGALLAAVAYAFSGFMYERNACCWPYAAVVAWLPMAVLGTEMALRRTRWIEPVAWWSLSGFALGQTAAAWPGQGSYYALLAVSGYVAYRTLLTPLPGSPGLAGRLGAFALHGAASPLIAGALAAASLLPRIEYVSLSNLAGGYDKEHAATAGLAVRDWVRIAGHGSPWYAGAAVLALALAAPLLVRARFNAPYWATLSLAALILSNATPTPLHAVLYRVPGFARMHPHGPDRTMVVFYLGVALLAGACLTALGERGEKARWLAAVPAVMVLSLLARAPGLSALPLVAAGAAVLSIAAGLGFPSRRRVLHGLQLALVLLVFADLAAGGERVIAAHKGVGGKNEMWKGKPERFYAPRGGEAFLRSLPSREPFRYVGFAPSPGNRRLPYTVLFASQPTIALGVNNRAFSTGLQDVQGYNAVHLVRYDQYLAAMNGRRQNYHDAEVFARALDSPLLDLLNARYIIAPARVNPKHTSTRRLLRTHPTVYGDDQVRIVENRGALPRAWLVHEARRVEPGEALDLLKSGQVSARRTALLEQTPPPLGRPADPGAERVMVLQHTPDRIRFRVSAKADALLVASEVYYPAWTASVDGRAAPLLVANHTFRAVPVPAGEHVVEMRFESATLHAGLAISGTTYALLAAVLAVCVLRWRRSRTGLDRADGRR